MNLPHWILRVREHLPEPEREHPWLLIAEVAVFGLLLCWSVFHPWGVAAW